LERYEYNIKSKFSIYLSSFQLPGNYILPTFIDFRINFLKKNITPFFIGSFGYSFGTVRGSYGGLYTNPSIGLKLKIASNFAFNFSIGLKFQEYKYLGYVLDSWLTEKVMKNNYGSLTAKLSVVF
jgi:hypothetical protein